MKKEGLHFFEPFTGDFTRLFMIDKVYYQGKTKYQSVQIFHSGLFGKILFLDGKIQSAEVDESIFHEALVHPGLLTHPAPHKVLIIGGGEGATARETLKHSPVREIVMVDIDRELVDLCKKYLPKWSEGSFSDKRTSIIFEDAERYIGRTKERFDVVISDLTEPLREGPSVNLFTREAFQKIFRTLAEDGLFVIQAGSADPHYHHFFSSCVKTLEGIFSFVRPYWTFIFSFSLPWGFIIASKKHDPLELEEKEVSRRMRERGVHKLRFFHPAHHSSLFNLPLYLIKALNKGRVLTDEKPFIWEA